MKINYQSTMHADGHYPPMIWRVQCRCYWMMQMLICIKINSYARKRKYIAEIIQILPVLLDVQRCLDAGMNAHLAKPLILKSEKTICEHTIELYNKE